MKIALTIGIAYGFLTIFFIFVGVLGIVIPWPITVALAGVISAIGFLDAYDCWRSKL